jgi:hypothetical protein
MTRLKKKLVETHDAIEQAQAAVQRLNSEPSGAADAAAELERRRPLVESISGFLIGRREQNGFSRDYRITALTRSDATERHA